MDGEYDCYRCVYAMCDDDCRLDSLIDVERSASLGRGEHGSDAWWRYSSALYLHV